MLHPVGRLPAAVYWRRRAVLLLVLLGLVAGIGWLVARVASGGGADVAATASAGPVPVSTPALEMVLPPLAAVELPETRPRAPAPGTTRPHVRPPAAEPPAAEPSGTLQPAGPTAGGPCTDEMIAVEVRGPAAVASGSKPAFELVVRNVSAVPCARDLDKELQELVLLDAAGARVWGSNDCFPEESDERRTMGPGNGAAFTIVWGGLSSEPTCTSERRPPPPGDYLLRGRLGTTVSEDRPLRIT